MSYTAKRPTLHLHEWLQKPQLQLWSLMLPNGVFTSPGYVDDVEGWDFGGSCADTACQRCQAGPDPSDSAGWGTHAAALVAGWEEEVAGTAGLAPDVSIMALKVGFNSHTGGGGSGTKKGRLGGGPGEVARRGGREGYK
jgi:hypothetical protein